MISHLTARMLDTVGLDIGLDMEICMTYLVTSIPQCLFYDLWINALQGDPPKIRAFCIKDLFL